MTDAPLVTKKLSFIESCLRELKTLARPDAIAADVRERRFVEHTLQIAIQAMLDVASHIVADDGLGEPGSNHELIELLARDGWVSAELAPTLRSMIGFRNILVHGYTEVDVAVLRNVLDHHLADLEAFVDSIRSRIR